MWAPAWDYGSPRHRGKARRRDRGVHHDRQRVGSVGDHVFHRAAGRSQDQLRPGQIGVGTGRRVFRGAKMKFHTEYLTFNTRQHREYVHITPQVEKIVRESGVSNGMALVSAMHITAGVYVNDNEEGLIHDIDKWLETLAPFQENYLHHQTGEDNGDSH